MRVRITNEDKQKARGLLLQRSIQVKPYYESKSDTKLIALFRRQIDNHFVDGCVISFDNLELFVVSGLLLERGFSKRKLQEIKDEIIAKNNEWRKNFKQSGAMP